MTLRERVMELRRAQRISQRRLAEKAGIARVTITRLESGDQQGATWQTVARLARAFGLTVDEFLKDIDEGLRAAVA